MFLHMSRENLADWVGVWAEYLLGTLRVYSRMRYWGFTLFFFQITHLKEMYENSVYPLNVVNTPVFNEKMIFLSRLYATLLRTSLHRVTKICKLLVVY